MKEACGPAHMKSILAIGELGSMNNVYKASYYLIIVYLEPLEHLTSSKLRWGFLA